MRKDVPGELGAEKKEGEGAKEWGVALVKLEPPNPHGATLPDEKATPKKSPAGEGIPLTGRKKPMLSK